MDPMIPNDRDTGPAGPEAADKLSNKGAARRRLGLGASGVILTLASKSGMATTPMYCGAVSGWQSASTASRTKSSSGKCTGVSAGYWTNHDWPRKCSRDAMFSTIFPEGRDTWYKDTSMYTVLTTNSPTDDKWNLRREFVAAWLNAEGQLNAHPNKMELQAIWKNYIMNGGNYVIASTGQTLGGSLLKDYLASSHEGI